MGDGLSGGSRFERRSLLLFWVPSVVVWGFYLGALCVWTSYLSFRFASRGTCMGAKKEAFCGGVLFGEGRPETHSWGYPILSYPILSYPIGRLCNVRGMSFWVLGLERVFWRVYMPFVNIIQ